MEWNLLCGDLGALRLLRYRAKRCERKGMFTSIATSCRSRVVEMMVIAQAQRRMRGLPGSSRPIDCILYVMLVLRICFSSCLLSLQLEPSSGRNAIFISKR